MNSKVLHLLNNLKEYSEKVTSTIEELRKVDWSALDRQVTEEDIGKLCRFSDKEDLSIGFYATLKSIKKYGSFPYYSDTGAPFKYCKRVTLKDLEGLL